MFKIPTIPSTKKQVNSVKFNEKLKCFQLADVQDLKNIGEFYIFFIYFVLIHQDRFLLERLIGPNFLENFFCVFQKASIGEDREG